MIDTPQAADSEAFVLSRVFDAPPALVWKALTERDHLVKWWGPKGFTMRVATLDLRPGGTFHYCMASPNGQEMWGKFVYKEVVAPERLVFINSFSDAKGGITRHPMAPDWPLEVFNVQTLTEANGKTTLSMRGTPHNATAAESKVFAAGHTSMQAGFKGTLDQLETYLAQSLR